MERNRNQYPIKNTNSFNVTSNYNQCNTQITIHPTIATDERSQILSWISPLEPWKRHHDIATKRVVGIGTWVVKAGKFKAWRQSRDNGSVGAVLFCYGLPGAGKTFVCSLAIDALCDETAGRNVGVGCLYCDYRGREDQMPTNMIGGLLKQLVSGLPQVPWDINEAYQTAKRQLGGRALLLPKIMDMFLKVLDLYEQAFLFIDALDELRIEYRVEFLRSLRQIIQRSPNTRIFITGRVYVQPELWKYLTKSLSMLSIHPKDGDLRTYLARRLDSDPDPDAMDDDPKCEILIHLPRRFPGIFLPIALQVDAILGETTIYSRRETLYRADVLDGVYTTALERIRRQDGSKSKLGIAVLRSVSLADRPLHVDELHHTLTGNDKSRDLNVKNVPSIQTLLSSCLGLVTFDRETSTVRLVHTTSMVPHGNLPGGTSGHSPAVMAPKSAPLTLDYTKAPLPSIPKHEPPAPLSGLRVYRCESCIALL